MTSGSYKLPVSLPYMSLMGQENVVTIAILYKAEEQYACGCN